MSIALSEIPSDFSIRTAIMHAVDGPLEDITVERICKRSNVSRTKFYSLFSSKFDIGYWYLDFVYDVSLGKIGRTLTWREGVELCLDLMAQERTYFSYTADTPVNVPNLYWLIRRDRVERIKEILKERNVPVSPLLHTEIDMYSMTIDNLLHEWVSPDCSLSIAEYTNLWVGLRTPQTFRCSAIAQTIDVNVALTISKDGPRTKADPLE